MKQGYYALGSVRVSVRLRALPGALHQVLSKTWQLQVLKRSVLDLILEPAHPELENINIDFL